MKMSTYLGRRSCLVFLILFIHSLSSIFCDPSNNVCNTVEDYAKINESKNCWYNPDAESKPEEIAHRYGFELEPHTVTTEDGYILTLFRLKGDSTQNGQPVLLQHGLMASAMCFMSAGKKSIAFFLANQGLDVWLGNFRGNGFSPNHTNLNTDDEEFWNFSFHEGGLYDIPAYLEYILAKNGQKAIYIGHSMGTTMGFIYSSLRKDHASKYLKGLIALCPVTDLTYSPVTGEDFPSYVKQALKAQELVITKDEEDFRDTVKFLCLRPGALGFCLKTSFKVFGKSDSELSPEDVPTMLHFFPSRTSAKCVRHFNQIGESNMFRPFDYGEEQNMKIYGRPDPPPYPLGEIASPAYLYYGKNDLLAPEDDAKKTFNALGSAEKGISSVPTTGDDVKYNHMDFLYGRNMEKYLYPPIMEAIGKLK